MGDVRLFRNTQGFDELKHITYGLGSGTSDLIGWRTMIVEPKDVGRELAVFVALECKTPRNKLTINQAAFLACVTKAGGLAGVVRSLEDAYKVLRY